jgi:hypothetical protein
MRGAARRHPPFGAIRRVLSGYQGRQLRFLLLPASSDRGDIQQHEQDQRRPECPKRSLYRPIDRPVCVGLVDKIVLPIQRAPPLKAAATAGAYYGSTVPNPGRPVSEITLPALLFSRMRPRSAASCA